MKKSLLLIAFVCSLLLTHAQSIFLHEVIDATHYSPTGRPRVAAEWEPAIGVLISWPLWLPKELVIDLANDSRLYVIVQGMSAQKEAVSVFTKWGIKPNQVKFIPAPQGVDHAWTRDWGPHGVFMPNGSLRLGDAKYEYSTPLTTLPCADTLVFLHTDNQNQPEKTLRDDRIPEAIMQFTEFDLLPLPFALTGGNFFTDGQRTAFSSCALLNENQYRGTNAEQFFDSVHKLLGINRYNVISNFELAGIQHIDCFMKLLDEESILVMRPPTDHPLYEQYEGIVNNELQFLKNAYGRPYQILRLDTRTFRGEELAAYSNALILNKKIYVPLFGIEQDSIALAQWQNAMPGYTVKGYLFNIAGEKVLDPECRKHYIDFGWKGSDALHCRTRAMWDPDMIYLSVMKLEPSVKYANSYTLDIICKDYSGKGFLPEDLSLRWRKKGGTTWNRVPMVATEITDHYKATIPKNDHGATIEYYVEAKSISGKYNSAPRVAPEGYYSFTITSNKR